MNAFNYVVAGIIAWLTLTYMVTQANPCSTFNNSSCDQAHLWGGK